MAGPQIENGFLRLGNELAEALMAVHRCYAPIVLPLLSEVDIHGLAHITGGGITGNLNRVMPDGYVNNNLMVVAPGAFIMLGVYIWIIRSIRPEEEV